jgi:hypothetical protein
MKIILVQVQELAHVLLRAKIPRYVLGSSHDAVLPEGAVYPAC